MKSPPTATTAVPEVTGRPRTASENGRTARAKMPAAGPLATGVENTDQVRPASVEWKTRERAPPPDAIQASRRPEVTRQVPDAAKANSPGSAAGIPAPDWTLQCWPPSVVRAIRNFPSVGSESAMPSDGLKNAMQS